MAKKSIFLLMAIPVFGIMLLFFSTDHFQALTAEQARRINVLQNSPEVPDVLLEDSKGEKFTFSDYRGQYILVTYIYATCGDVCPLVEMNFNKIYTQLPPKILGKKIQLLSISFDPAQDTPEMLEHHREMYEADGVYWKMARVPNQKELDLLLEQSGVIVLPIENGFEHNAAFYLINPEGQLIRIFNFDSPNEVVKELREIISY